MTVSYALIADIIRSRELPDRRRAQHVIYETLDRAAEDLALTQHPYATVGDELQAVSATLTDALALTLRTHLLLPEGLGLRFGIGAGAISEVDGGVAGGPHGAAGRLVQDGSAWWAAREAIETQAADTQRRRVPQRGAVGPLGQGVRAASPDPHRSRSRTAPPAPTGGTSTTFPTTSAEPDSIPLSTASAAHDGRAPHGGDSGGGRPSGEGESAGRI